MQNSSLDLPRPGYRRAGPDLSCLDARLVGAKVKNYFEILGQFLQIARKRRKIRSFRKVSDKEITRLYQGAIVVSGMKNPLMDYVLRPLLSAYWKLIRGWI
jgi:hypothetical protein